LREALALLTAGKEFVGTWDDDALCAAGIQPT
jgi:hypothetical protein